MNEHNEIIGREYTFRVFLLENHVIIPAYQRDYAQGRSTAKAYDVREHFLADLKDTLMNEDYQTLDFAYGQKDESGKLVLVDGQQRMTTLFLLHWYVAFIERVIGGKAESAWNFLRNFTYETRYSSREFFQLLLSPEFCANLYREMSENADKQDIADAIRRRREVPKEWSMKDPTVSAALTMLGAIDETFRDIVDENSDIWNKLAEQKLITFQFIPLEDMGETDQLYIRMNSRGRLLTPFENAKAELLESLREAGYDDDADEIGIAMDGAWADMVWPYRANQEAGDIGHEMLNFFKFACDIIWFKNNDTRWNKTGNAKNSPHELIRMLFSNKPDGSETQFPTCGTLKDNISELKACFQCWTDLEPEKIDRFFDANFTSAAHETGKVPVRTKLTLLKACLQNGWNTNSWNWEFSLRDIDLPLLLQLYACMSLFDSDNRDVLLNPESFVFTPEGLRRYRRVINLIRNSTDEIRDDAQTNRGRLRNLNRIPVMLEHIDNILQENRIPEPPKSEADDSSLSFNSSQLKEEKKKQTWLQSNSPAYDRDEELFALEDHPFLDGHISAIELNPANLESLKQAFEKLFDESVSDFDEQLDLIDCALMAIGDHMQKLSSFGKYQSGSKNKDAWSRLFHQNETEHTALNKLLDSIKIDRDITVQLVEIRDSFLAECEENKHFPFAYYYVKYDAFRSARYGVYHWDDKENKPYELLKLETKTNISNASVQPFLAEVAPDKINAQDLGWSLSIDGHTIRCRNDGFTVDDELDLEIHQDNGTDTEDRIQELKAHLRGKGWL